MNKEKMKSTSRPLRRLEKEPVFNNQAIKTDFPEFDEFKGGLQPGQLILSLQSLILIK